MKAQHTPGLWKIDGAGNEVSSRSKSIAHVYGHLPSGYASEVEWSIEDLANARLIAAAPELLDALLNCEAIMSAIECGHMKPLGFSTVLEEARDAIAKAKGLS